MNTTPPHIHPKLAHAADQAGQTLTEYALLISLIAILVVAAFPALNGALRSLFTSVTAAFGG